MNRQKPVVAFSKSQWLGLVRWLRWSLAALWFWTALCSVWLNMPESMALLDALPVSGSAKKTVVYCASGLDFLIGVWLLTAWRMRLCYAVQIVVTVCFTLLATVLVPDAWLHPFGMLSKNIPIVAMLVLLYCLDTNTQANKLPAV